MLLKWQEAAEGWAAPDPDLTLGSSTAEKDPRDLASLLGGQCSAQSPGQHSPPPTLMSRHPDLGGPSDSASWGKALEWGGEGSSAGQISALGRKGVPERVTQ